MTTWSYSYLDKIAEVLVTQVPEISRSKREISYDVSLDVLYLLYDLSLLDTEEIEQLCSKTGKNE